MNKKTSDKLALVLLAAVTVMMCLLAWSAGRRMTPADVLSQLTVDRVTDLSVSRFPKDDAPMHYTPTEAERVWLTAQLSALEERDFSLCRKFGDYRKGNLYLRFSMEDHLAELLLQPVEQEEGWFSMTFDETTAGLFDRHYRVFWPELAQWLNEVLP